MLEPTPQEDGLQKQTGPKWDQLDDKTVNDIRLVLKGTLQSESEVVVDSNVVFYPAINGEKDPLSDAHFNILKGVVESKGDESGLFVGLVPSKGKDGIMYFATPSSKGEALEERDELIRRANDLIATLGGNKFIPQRLNN